MKAYVQRTPARASGQHPIPGQAVRSASLNTSRPPAWTSALALQSPLAISQPGDIFEQDAERAAGRVMRMAEPVLQREKGKTAEARDVALILSTDFDAKAEAAALSPDAYVIVADSPEDLAKKLKKVNFPIKTLFIISHSLSSGDIAFQKGDETRFVMPSELAGALKDSIAPQNAPQLVDFRGCSVGAAPAEMDKIRSSLGAQAAVGGNCFMIMRANGPVLLNKKPITKPGQVTASNREAFQEGFQKLIESFGPAKHCIIDPSEKSYFRNNGRLVALWLTPEFSTEWNARKSRCYGALKPETVDPAKVNPDDVDPGLAGQCRLIRVEGSPQAANPSSKSD